MLHDDAVQTHTGSPVRLCRPNEDEIHVVDTEAYQRLRRIKQMSHAYLVYPTAVHSRFEHTLGATHISGRMCDALGIDGEDRTNVRLAVLLHDIGHGPLSHLFERVLEKVTPACQTYTSLFRGR